MLSEEQIQQALHAHSVTSLGVANPHGPLGLEQLAEAVARRRASHVGADRVEKSITLPLETWQKLHELARNTTRAGRSPLTASDVAAAILELSVNGN